MRQTTDGSSSATRHIMCNLCKLDHLLKYFVLKIVFANLNGVKHTAEAEWKPHLLLCWKYQSHDSWLTLPFKDSFEHISEHLDARKDAAWPPASKATPSPFRQGFSDKLLTSHSFEKDTRELKITCCCKYLQIWYGVSNIYQFCKSYLAKWPAWLTVHIWPTVCIRQNAIHYLIQKI